MEIKTKGRSTRQGEGKGKSQSKNSLLSIEAENQPRTYYHTTNIVMGFGLMKNLYYQYKKMIWLSVVMRE